MISVAEPSPSDESLGFLSNESRSGIVGSADVYWLTKLDRRRSWWYEWAPPPLDYGPMRRNRSQVPEISMAAGGTFIRNMIDTVNTLFPIHVDDRSALHFWIESDLLAMFIAAFVATQHDPDARAYYQRKRAEGKKHNATVICVAGRRCDLILAMLKNAEPYNPTRHQELPIAA